MNITQTPIPGTHILLHNGDILEVKLHADPDFKGKAYLRTNLGNAAVRRAETISLVRTGFASAGQDWHDIAMTRHSDGSFMVRLALTEAGHFEAKSFLLSGSTNEVLWPDGENIHINVSPAGYCSSNAIYCAFVRQFGANKTNQSTPGAGEGIPVLDHDGYTVIPPSGTFRDLIGELDHIFNKLKCRILHLLPINPVPTTYARMGRFGSPYAATDFESVDPALAEFDRKATPMDQFLELVDAVHGFDGKLFIDIAVNHTGWGSRIHTEHPEWLKHNPDGSIKSPGAWGTIWEDLTELDYTNRELWKYIAKVFLMWCSRGVDGFRCDAGYMIPVPAWEYIIAEVRNEFPDTIFLLEGLGGDPAVTARLLDFANMNWAYSELFQNYTRPQIEGYLKYAWQQSNGDGLMVHYAETHDNLRLAARSKRYSHMRTGLCALSSINGAFGFANGVEWYATEKIDVHEARALSWGAEENQIEYIARLNTILRRHPAFHNGAELKFIDSGNPDAVLIHRTDAQKQHSVLVAVNLNCEQESEIAWAPEESFTEETECCDLLDYSNLAFLCCKDGKCHYKLAPGEVKCLTCDPAALQEVRTALPIVFDRFSDTGFQEAKHMALKTICSFRNANILHENEDPDQLAHILLENPENFLRQIQPDEVGIPYTIWNWPDDLKRVVMVPPGRCLLILSPIRFRAALRVGDHNIRQYDSLVDSHGRHFAIFNPIAAEKIHAEAVIQIASSSEKGKLQRGTGNLLFLAPDIEWTPSCYSHDDIQKAPLFHLQSNGRGGISHIRLDMPNISSRYDAVMLANINPDHPEDRHIMFRRIRIWMIYHARTQEVALNCLTSFDVAEDGSGLWNYRIPAGNGMYVLAVLKIQMVHNRNAVRISMHRLDTESGKKLLPVESSVKFLLRLDLEDRNFHYATKAQCVEKVWPNCITAEKRWMSFAPANDRVLFFIASAGKFVRNDEWTYNLWQQNEADRGLDPCSDLYSPGYFEIDMHGGDFYQLTSTLLTPSEPEPIRPDFIDKTCFTKRQDHSVEHAMLYAMREFVVKRDSLKTVIAGYPWFLDWGRDTLIAARGLIAAPEFRDDVKKILCQFASFAENGTIPNIIHGSDVSNRDTSDAPLWLFTAVSDLCKAEGHTEFLKTEVKAGVTLRETLELILYGIMNGTPNGILMDPVSGLIFSPSHFTWMDTNYPAGTPREGYPVEIQALWFAALRFMSALPDAAPGFGELADRVQRSINKLFRSDDGKYLSDCLHCKSGTPAEKAVKDDHIRPNQLYAVTLGAVTDKSFARSILKVCEQLLIPGAIRSLAAKPVKYALPVYHNGSLLNNPLFPYQGHYEGDEDTCRKKAYHNGTAWTWQFPAYCEALLMTYGQYGKETAESILSTSENLFHNGCVGELAEIVDGDYPHKARGCDAQAWGITELYRVWKMMHGNLNA